MLLIGLGVRGYYTTTSSFCKANNAKNYTKNKAVSYQSVPAISNSLEKAVLFASFFNAFQICFLTFNNQT